MSSGPLQAKAKDGHVHLTVSDPVAAHARPWNWARWPVVGCGVSAIGAFAAAFFVPWWHFWLYAPQYPKGLELLISLTGMGGDAHEIDLLNHYIGMGHLESAAPLERRIAGYGVAAICVVTLAALTLAGKKLNKLVAIPAISFPVVFLADSFYWLYRFGHALDPHAPLRIAPFTPQLFGNGQIGQFETFAQPEIGFWLACAGVALAIVGTVLRARVCAHCTSAGTCSAVCPRLMVLHAPGAEAPK
jgi:copper chaperone NosL